MSANHCLLALLFVLCNVTVQAQNSPLTRLNGKPSRTINHITKVEAETKVKTLNEEESDSPVEHAGTKSRWERTLQVTLTKTSKGLQAEFTWQRLRFWLDKVQPEYDSKNAFERTTMGDDMGKVWDRYMNKKAFLLYKLGVEKADTIQKPFKDYFVRWAGYKAVTLSVDRQTPWDNLFIDDLSKHPMRQGEQWISPSVDDNYRYTDKYTVLDVTDKKVTLALLRSGVAINLALPTNGLAPKASGIYWGPTKATGKLTVDRYTGLIDRMEVSGETIRVQVDKKSTIQITRSFKGIVTNN